MAKITKNFTTDEMKCPCCDKCDMDMEFMENLEMRCTKNGTRQLRLSYLALEVTYTEAAAADNATFFGANF